MKFIKHKQRFTVIQSSREVVCALDVAKVADVLLFVANMADGEEECIDDVSNLFIAYLLY